VGFGKIIFRSRQSAFSEQTGSVLGKIFAYGETKQFCLRMLFKIILPKDSYLKIVAELVGNYT